jgi:hypothetical protein
MVDGSVHIYTFNADPPGAGYGPIALDELRHLAGHRPIVVFDAGNEGSKSRKFWLREKAAGRIDEIR